ncbi:hypothetical protein ACFQAT_19155 [Undibacterium arcticum]|uniref:hypothetical protein n=1 Tax=Undibacterium arcticum TaxID=1762892 RepID=UPI0036087A2B
MNKTEGGIYPMPFFLTVATSGPIPVFDQATKRQENSMKIEIHPRSSGILRSALSSSKVRSSVKS